MRRQRPKLFLKGRSARTRRRLLLVFLTLFAAQASSRPASADCVPFGAQTLVGTAADRPQEVAVADLDGDGDLDFVATSREGDSVLWYENQGDGAAWVLHTIAEGINGPASADAADLDGDGDLDVAVAAYYAHQVVWYENNGTEAVWSPHTVGTVFDVQLVRAAEVERDGDVDLFVAVPGSGQLLLFKNGGSGLVWTSSLLSTPSGAPQGIFPADVDGDGDVDQLAVDPSTDTLLWHRNNGMFWQRLTISTLADARSVAGADVDRDGDLDALVANGTQGNVAWHENLNSFGTSWTRHSIGTLTAAFAVAAADFDADGDPDALVSTTTSDRVAWFESPGGDGTWTLHPISTALDQPLGVAAADLDRDGDLDAISASFNDDKIAWYPNRRLHGAAIFGASATVAAGPEPEQIAAADVDGDGDLDLVVVDPTENPELAWFQNLDPGWSLHTISGNLDFTSFAVSDVDRDGVLDVVASAFGSSAVAWYKNDGTPAGDSQWNEHRIATLPEAGAVAVADLDGDGDPDVVAAAYLDDDVVWYENDGTPLFGDWPVRTIWASAPGAEFVAVADFDRDGDIDVLSSSYGDDTVRTHRSDGTPANGGWTTDIVSSDLPNPMRRFIVGDFDRDDTVDFAVPVPNLDGVIVFRNTAGTGTSWGRATVTTSLDSTEAVAAADLDGDGDLDFAVAGFGEDLVSWYENDGAAGGWSEHPIASAPNPDQLTVADFDGDGTPDVAVAISSNLLAVPNRRGLVFAEGLETNESTACWSDAVP